jgi:hypothetical protein
MAEENQSVEEQEHEIVVDQTEESTEKVQVAESEDGELENYSQNVQKRIKKLTERYRNEQRDREEAVRVAQKLLDENSQLKGRVQQLDSGYLNEYGNRLTTQETSARNAYKAAYDSGDSDAMLAAQEQLSQIAIDKQRYGAAKTRVEQQKALAKQQVQAQPQAAPQQPTPQQQQAKVDPKAKSWAETNNWFGNDEIMTTAAFTIHRRLIEDEGFDPQSDEYYTAIDSRIRSEFPHKFESAKKSGGGSQVASAGNSASRSTKQGRRSVKLTHSQVAIAKKLGVPLEEYAKYVKE